MHVSGLNAGLQKELQAVEPLHIYRTIFEGKMSTVQLGLAVDGRRSQSNFGDYMARFLYYEPRFLSAVLMIIAL